MIREVCVDVIVCPIRVIVLALQIVCLVIRRVSKVIHRFVVVEVLCLQYFFSCTMGKGYC